MESLFKTLTRIKEQVVREYFMEILSSFTFRDHIEELDEADTMESAHQLQPHPICRHSGKENVTLDDLFLLHSMDGGVSVDIPWHVAKFLSDKAKGSKSKSPIIGAHLIGNIASYYGYNGLGIGEMVAEILEVTGEDDVGAGQAEIGGVGRHPNMSNANRLRAMDERLGEIVNDVLELTYVGVNFVSGTPNYSTAPSPSASQFGMFSDAHPSTSRNQDDMNED
ncbi:hypothetical protein Tco_0600444 [Tanacetum coccineum]|uniref:Uncharacterized protein n=1 Tax=Tanacetum coccineum TaxID=301880 RepID=A0ABQ4WBW7_9ASTR